MKFIYNDGGRSNYFKGKAGDCGTRAIAIALEIPYIEVYDELNNIRKHLLSKTRSNRLKKLLSGSVRDGTAKEVMHEFMKRHNWQWIPTMKIGSGCKVHLTENELPNDKIICCVSKHYTAVINGVINDTYNPNDRGITVDQDGNNITTDRCVYGYWKYNN